MTMVPPSVPNTSPREDLFFFSSCVQACGQFARSSPRHPLIPFLKKTRSLLRSPVLFGSYAASFKASVKARSLSWAPLPNHADCKRLSSEPRTWSTKWVIAL